MVECDQFLRDLTSFRVVCLEQRRRTTAFDDRCKFPSQIVSYGEVRRLPEGEWPGKGGPGSLTVLHTDIHSLARLGTVGVHGVTSQKHSAVGRKLGAQPLANLISSPPVAMLEAERVRTQDFLCSESQGFRVDLVAIEHFTCLVRLRDLNIQPDVFVFPRNDHHAAGHRVNGAPVSDVGKIRDWNHVEDAPDKVGLFSLHDTADLTSSPRMCPITANHVFGQDLFSAGGCIVLSRCE